MVWYWNIGVVIVVVLVEEIYYCSIQSGHFNDALVSVRSTIGNRRTYHKILTLASYIITYILQAIS